MPLSRKQLSFAIVSALPWLSLAAPSLRANDIHFDYTSFDNPNTPGISPHFGQAQFDVLNYPSLNGNYMMTSTDNHRPEMVANGNALAEFYNNFLIDYNNQFNGGTLNATAEADAINSYTNLHSTNNGPRPDWLILNEISTSVWQDTTAKGIAYRQWVIDVASRLNDTYNYSVVTYSPFATVGNNDSSWQALAAKSYIGVENYLSGTEVLNSGSTSAQRLAWCQAQYQASKNTYAARGVDPSRLFLGEDFGNTIGGKGFGRSGISASDWDTVIQIRQDAIHAVGFPGFLAYAWGSNTMKITEAEQIQHEYYYRSRLVLPGQQPQWLSDDAINVNGTVIPLSWNQPLNWIGGVPNGAGAVANFYRTNTAPRTITLDGAQTVGTLTFDSPQSYTIAPGTGGSLILNNASSPANVSVSSGSHTITAPITLLGNANFSVTAPGSTLTLSADVSAAGRTINKLGPGTLAMKNVRAAGLNISAGKLAILANGSASGVSKIGSLSIVSGAIFDLTNNKLIAGGNNTGNWDGTKYTGITGMVVSGRIDSSSIGAGDTLHSIGMAPAADVLGLSGSQTTLWNGQSVGAGDTLVMYTFAGDANLDGQINIDDYGRIDGNIGLPGASGWANGDFNYDGKINIDDYGIIDGNIGIQGAPIPTAAQTLAGFADTSVTAVPEPASLAILAFAAFPILRRRHHPSKPL